MSYAIRNTIILLLVLVFISGFGYAYMYFVQKPMIEERAESIESLELRYTRDLEAADTVPLLRERYADSQSFIDNFDKTIFRNNNTDEVYRFLSRINDRFRLDFNYVLEDSTINDSYGVIKAEISGTGSYRNFIEFVNSIENSEPVQKINNLTVTPAGQTSGFQNVNFTFNLSSKYDSKSIFTSTGTPAIRTMSLVSAHNPFFPLIRSVVPNVNNLPDLDNSRLIGVSEIEVYLIDQKGDLVTLRPNDRVYLGRLQSINSLEGEAIFRLNRGGIIESVIKKVQQ
ncbi:MAG: hypothetical protein EA390_01050 [Balneolaceae bacterium]|nr:MAG: hypothetical protein EA390_01050 [Balneolaceae bacterium]